MSAINSYIDRILRPFSSIRTSKTSKRRSLPALESYDYVTVRGSKSTNPEKAQSITPEPQCPDNDIHPALRGLQDSPTKIAPRVVPESSLELPNSHLPFYFPHYALQPDAREIMTHHGVTDRLLSAHIQRLQQRAWALFPYPCVGVYEFIRFNLPTYPLHPQLLSLLRSGGLYLDIGCCFGQDIRYLANQPGIDPLNLYGTDLRQEFIDLGYELFLDRDQLMSRIRQADLFDDESWVMREMRGALSVVHLSYVLHLWGWEKQVDAVRRVVRLLKREKGCMVVGRSVGSEVPGEFVHPTVGVMFRHDEETFRKMWVENCGCEVEVKVKVGKSRRVSADGKKWFEHPPMERAIELEWAVVLV